MRTAIISNLVTKDIPKNQKKLLSLAAQGIEEGAEFVLFPEAAATGLVNTGNPNSDYKIAEPLSGPRNSEWSNLAREHGVYFGAGFLEIDGKCIFDSAALYNPEGKLILHYRRNEAGWHSVYDDSSIYCEGNQIPVVETPVGRLAFLICGDLWNDRVLSNLTKKRPDYLLYIFARDIVPRKQLESLWRSEFQSYQERWMKTRSKVLAVNLLSDIHNFGSIGGAWYIDSTGQLLSSSPILEEHILLIDMKTERTCSGSSGYRTTKL